MDKERLRKLLVLVLLVVFIGSALMLAGLLKRYVDARARNNQAQAYIHLQPDAPYVPTEPDAPEQESPPPVPPEVDFAALQAINSDICAWLWMPDTAISYPVLHGRNNDRYLDTAFDGEHSITGSIFMDSRNSGDFSDENTILYGHNMKDGSMFGTLKKFRGQEYADTRRLVYLILPQKTLVYRVFAVYDTQAVDQCYTRSFDSAEARTAEIERAAKRSNITPDMQVAPAQVERYLTLSTCTVSDANRLVLQAYYVGEAGQEPEPAAEPEPEPASAAGQTPAA